MAALKTTDQVQKQQRIETAIQKKKREYCWKDCSIFCCITAGAVVPCMLSVGLCLSFRKNYWEPEKKRRAAELESIRQGHST
jgi:uncharacterized Fe-S cluster-containing radical SAM superfamily protein